MKQEDIFLTVVVPVYNEESRFEAPLAQVHDFLSVHFPKSELIYVDDGSTDRTYEKLEETQKRYSRMRLVRGPQNAGKGDAVRRGFSAASGNVLLFSDADFSTPIEESLRLLNLLLEGDDIAIGSRGLAESRIEVHQSFLRESMGKTFNLIIRCLLPLPFHDTQCGFKMFRKEAADLIVSRMTLRGFAFDVEMLTIARLHQLKIAEVPVVWRDVRESKVHPIKNSLEMLRDVLKIRYRLSMNRYS
jgi:dolichyl-phosphate beta-glucosyltransferase